MTERGRLPQRKQAAAPKPVAVAVPLERHLVPAGLAALTVVIGATLLPFWTTGLIVGLAFAAAVATIRSPRLGLAIALFVPVFPLGNVAQAAAVIYGALAVGWLALCWRDARAGLLFMAGPVLAAVGLLALLPLAVQPARGRVRRALQAYAGVFAAVAVAGLRGNSLPMTTSTVPNLGIDESTSIATVLAPVAALLERNGGFATVALALALVRSVPSGRAPARPARNRDSRGRADRVRRRRSRQR